MYKNNVKRLWKQFETYKNTLLGSLSMAFDFAKAREYMVWSQMETSGVRNEKILDAFRHTPRESFVSEDKFSVAYKDEDISLGQGRIMMEPSVHARLLQALNIKPSDVVLNIGSATGYSTAIFSQIASTIVQVENNKDMLTFSEEQFLQLQFANIVSFSNSIEKGCAAHAPYDIIFINGAVSQRPSDLLKQLGVGGRCACVVKKGDMGQGKATLYERVTEDNISEKTLFDASIPYLNGFEPVEEFSL